VVVLPGHGEQTSIGRERATNPYLLDLLTEGTADRVTRGL
jgi:hydroxyacylglutathione hydrolase